MVLLNGFNIANGPYPFFRVHDQSVRATALWMLALLATVTALSAIVCLAARG